MYSIKLNNIKVAWPPLETWEAWEEITCEIEKKVGFDFVWNELWGVHLGLPHVAIRKKNIATP